MLQVIESKKIQFLITVFFVLLFLFIIFFNLGTRPLVDYDESIYAQVAKESFYNRNQLGFTWLGNTAFYRTEFWFEKPPLMIWLTESAYFVFGVNEFAARFWPALFATLSMWLTFLFAKKLSQSFLVGIFTISVFLISFQFIFSAGMLQFDITVGFFILLSLFSFSLGQENSKYYFLFWLALGLGVLTKSVIGLFPLPIIFIYSLLAKDFGYLKIKDFYLGSLLFFAIILPWHIIEGIRYGKVFWEQYLFYHLLKRYSTGIEGNGQSFFYYLGLISKQRLLFYSFTLSFVYFIVKSFESKKYVFMITPPLFIMLFFSFSETKLHNYILIIYPYIAIIIGTAIGDLSKNLKRYHKNLPHLFTLSVMLFFLFLGIRYHHYKLITINFDSKTTGEFLKKNHLNLPIYNFSITQTSPSIIYYSDRVIYPLQDLTLKPQAEFLLISEMQPHFDNHEIIFTTDTKKIYYVK